MAAGPREGPPLAGSSRAPPAHEGSAGSTGTAAALGPPSTQVALDEA